MSNKNVFFHGSVEVFKIPLKKIVSVEPYSDGIGIYRDGQNAKPQFFKVDDPWFAANLISYAGAADIVA